MEVSKIHTQLLLGNVFEIVYLNESYRCGRIKLKKTSEYSAVKMKSGRIESRARLWYWWCRLALHVVCF
jgi:hypothetical protein